MNLLRPVGWILTKLGIQTERISRGDNDELYLTRWIFRKPKDGKKLYLHCFHQSDSEVLHCHPWPYTSIILWGGYYETTPEGRKWYGPGSILKRPATWKHRIELYKNKPVWTLFIAGPKEREWFFWCPDGPIHNVEGHKNLMTKGNICES